MKKLPINRISAGILGLTSAATLGIAQQAEAGTVRGTAQLTASDVSLQLITAGGSTNIVPLFFETLQGSAFVNPFPGKSGPSDFDAYAQGPLQCPVDVSETAMASTVAGFTNVTSGLDCAPVSDPAVAFANAETILTGDNGSSNGNANYTIFSDNFTVEAGDVLDFDAIVSLFVEAEITGYSNGDMKTAAADLLGTYEIFLDDEVVFSGLPLDFAAALVNQNGVDTNIDAVIDVNTLPGGVDYTFLAGGEAEIQFSVRQQVSASVMRVSVPEPSAVISLAAVGVGALVSRNKRNKNAK